MLRGEPTTLQGDGEQGRDFTYIANAVSANLLALAAPADKIAGRVFNIACGERHSLNELHRTLAALTGYTLPPQHTAARAGDIRDSLADISAARTAFGYTPLVGFEEGLRRTVAWHREQLAICLLYTSTGKDYAPAEDPGVESVTQIYHYYKKFGYKTVVMGASFRNMGEIVELAGCDLLTIAPKLLQELQTTEGSLVRKLDPETAKASDIQKITVDKATFDKMHAENRMAHDKLKEGIEGFSKALEDLEKLLAKRVAELPKPEPAVAR